MAGAGYPGTPLWKKLGIKPGSTIRLLEAPTGYRNLLAPLPEGVQCVARLSRATDIVHIFSTRAAQLEKALPVLRKRMRADAALWVSWPKKAARLPTDFSKELR